VTIAAVAILGVLFVSQLEPPEPPHVMKQTIYAADGLQVTLMISKTEAERIPSWNPETGEPAPLSLKLAIELARDSVRVRNPSLSEFQVQSVETSRLDGRFEDKWYYVVKFRPVVEGRVLRGAGYVAMVLHDGTVKEPELSERPSN
jgi:hypothetical protein